MGKFNEDLRHVTNPNRARADFVFGRLAADHRSIRGNVTDWRFSCTLKEAGQ